MVLVFSVTDSNRLTYVLDEVLVHRFGLNYKITNSIDYFDKSKTIKINYGTSIIEGCINIPATNFLFQEGIIKQSLEVKPNEKWKFLFFEKAYEHIPDFKINTNYLPFDLFSAIFYLLSRYEEYLPSTKDKHQRYQHQNSIAYKNGFLQMPLVDFWLNQFKIELKRQYENIEFTTYTFKQLNTVDIDFAYKFKGHTKLRILKKAIGSILKGKWNPEIFKKNKDDAYDTYEYLIQEASRKNITTYFFFLLANYGAYDKNLSPFSVVYQDLIKKLNKSFTCGIHPSYRSVFDKKALLKELAIFENSTSKKALISRNHFLKIKFPDTYVQLEKAGIQTDYSLAYSEITGFRASTSFPFLFFNLHQNCSSKLWVQPACVMDVTLKNAMNLDLTKAIEVIHQLKKEIMRVNGVFVSIWHNSSFDEEEGWLGWQAVYQSLFDDFK